VTVTSYREVLSAAQQMPPADQAELIATLIQSLRVWLRGKPAAPMDSDPAPLSSLSQAELRVLADAAVAPGRQATLHDLLEKNRGGALSAAEEVKLDTLLEETDQVALLKARARYTLNLMRVSTEMPG
jgi:hypothetical protein